MINTLNASDMRSMMLLLFRLIPETREQLPRDVLRCVQGIPLYDDDEERDHSGPDDYRETIAMGWASLFLLEDEDTGQPKLHIERLLMLLVGAWLFFAMHDEVAGNMQDGIGMADSAGGNEGTTRLIQAILDHAARPMMTLRRKTS